MIQAAVIGSLRPWSRPVAGNIAAADLEWRGEARHPRSHDGRRAASPVPSGMPIARPVPAAGWRGGWQSAADRCGSWPAERRSPTRFSSPGMPRRRAAEAGAVSRGERSSVRHCRSQGAISIQRPCRVPYRANHPINIGSGAVRGFPPGLSPVFPRFFPYCFPPKRRGSTLAARGTLWARLVCGVANL
jgi:hypothetical protein